MRGGGGRIGGGETSPRRPDAGETGAEGREWEKPGEQSHRGSENGAVRMERRRRRKKKRPEILLSSLATVKREEESYRRLQN